MQYLETDCSPQVKKLKTQHINVDQTTSMMDYFGETYLANSLDCICFVQPKKKPDGSNDYEIIYRNASFEGLCGKISNFVDAFVKAEERETVTAHLNKLVEQPNNRCVYVPNLKSYLVVEQGLQPFITMIMKSIG
jgi:hypothetical protein